MRLLLILFLISNSLLCIAQGDEKGDIDARFLFNYYDQDGEHSAVTAGEGSQKLTDRSLDISLQIPVDSLRSLRFFGHVNYYSSASSDKIDYNVSSASSDDVRLQLQLGYLYSDNKGRSRSFDLGNSLESDYLSRYVLAAHSFPIAGGSARLSLDLGLFFDRWALITADEMRIEQMLFQTDRRTTYQFGLQYLQNLGDRLQVGLYIQPIFQEGLLSTPFHRVLTEGDSIVTEVFPGQRLRFPASVQADLAISPSLFINASYRFYSDDFGILGHSISLGVPIFSPWSMDLTPFFRYHRQSGARFFYDIGKTPINAEFRSSDFDLSNLSSYKIGLAVNKQLLNRERKGTSIDELSLRFGLYRRSDGLRSGFLSLGLRMLIAQKKPI